MNFHSPMTIEAQLLQGYLNIREWNTMEMNLYIRELSDSEFGLDTILGYRVLLKKNAKLIPMSIQ